MITKTITVSYPEIKMERTDFVIGVPEIQTDTRKVIFHTPTITVKRISVEVRETEKRAEDMEREFNKDTEEAVAEFRSDVAGRIEGPHTAMFACYRQNTSPDGTLRGVLALPAAGMVVASQERHGQ